MRFKQKCKMVYIALFSYKDNWEQAELNILRKTMGLYMPLKLSMKKKAASRVGHLPCLSVASKASL